MKMHTCRLYARIYGGPAACTGAARLLFSFGEKKNEYLCVFVCTPRNAINFTQWCYVLMLFMGIHCVRAKNAPAKNAPLIKHLERDSEATYMSKFIFTSQDKWMMLTFSKIGQSLHRAFPNDCIFLRWKDLIFVSIIQISVLILFQYF